MVHALLIAAALGAQGWHFDTQRDPIGQPVYTAEVRPDPARQHVSIKFSCGGIIGVVLQFNLGEIKYADSQFSTRDPEWEDVRFTFAEGKYDTTAKRSPITDGLGTYEIKGSDAFFIARQLKAGGSVTVSRRRLAFEFPLDGAGFAIGEAMASCPFQYPE